MSEETRKVIAEQATQITRVVQRSAQGGPPGNEIPVAIAVTFQWRGEGIVIAIPALLVSTTAVGMLVLGRTRAARPQAVEQTRADMLSLRGLTMNGRPVEYMTGQHDDQGFMYHVWAMFQPEEDVRDLVFALDWPGIAPVEHRMPAATITEAVRQVTALWS